MTGQTDQPDPPFGKRMPDGAILIRIVGVYERTGYMGYAWEFVRSYDEDDREPVGGSTLDRFEGYLDDRIRDFAHHVISDCSHCMLDGETYRVKTTLRGETQSATDVWEFRYSPEMLDSFWEEPSD